jgi:AraC-like DNA-binding protein/mannose-6-phosphate isomerase-like protein (cupin superfamily)
LAALRADSDGRILADRAPEPFVDRVNHCRDWAIAGTAQPPLADINDLAILRSGGQRRRVKAMKHSADLLGIARPVIALSDEYPSGFVDPMHLHTRTQILYASSGVMSVRTDKSTSVVPPQRAVWIPAGLRHEVSCRSSVSLRTLYIDGTLGREPQRCRVFEVSPFLRALILEVVEFKPNYDLDGREGRIVALMLEEIDRMPSAPYLVNMPADPRLLRVCRALVANPADGRDLDDWARIAGMGRRTFTRTFKNETGMGVGIWRQQARLVHALSLLSTGKSITTVSFEVGYDSPSAFTAMFHRAFGVPPSQFEVCSTTPSQARNASRENDAAAQAPAARRRERGTDDQGQAVKPKRLPPRGSGKRTFKQQAQGG